MGESMKTEEIRLKVFCQSCGMPLERTEDLGTNADASRNMEYCLYCYQKGEFTVPDITLEQMIDKCSHIMSDMKIMDFEEAKKMNSAFLPTLGRWKC